MPQLTTAPAQIVADTIVRTVELGVTITNAALEGETTVVFADLRTDGPGRCPDCGLAGVYRDSVERRVTDVPVVGHPLQRGCVFRGIGARARARARAASVRCSPTTPAVWPAPVPRPPGGVHGSFCAG